MTHRQTFSRAKDPFANPGPMSRYSFVSNPGSKGSDDFPGNLDNDQRQAEEDRPVEENGASQGDPEELPHVRLPHLPQFHGIHIAKELRAELPQQFRVKIFVFVNHVSNKVEILVFQ